MKRFYVSYLQNCAYACMECHVVVEAEDQVYVFDNYTKLISAQGYACGPAFGHKESLTACFEIPEELSHMGGDEILKHYDEFNFDKQWYAPSRRSGFIKRIFSKTP